MKSIIKYILLLIIPLLMIGGLTTSCDKDDEGIEITGTPVVKYIRSTNPDQADSLIVGAFMGSLIAVVGENLGHTREMWFNDQKATLNPAYVTNNSILVNVPSTVPSEVTNYIRFVFSDDTELLYDFSVNVPGPELASVKSEYVPDGGILVLHGDFFFEPEVIFPGDLQGQLVEVEKTSIQVVVPDGATVGPIVVKTNFGKATSSFIFRDDRNILLDFDAIVHETWTAKIAGGNDLPEITPVSGNYAYFKNDDFGAWQWVNEMTLQYWAPRGRGNVPVATGNINDLVLRFETNVPIEWKEVRMEIFFAPFSEDHGRDLPSTAMARWKPWVNGPFKTDGWVTISIPLSEFKYNKDDASDDEIGTAALENLTSLTNITMMMFGPAEGTNPVLVAVDNVRVVPL
ncbi:MAG: hypothetical protein DHS20C18_18180 [Saprospiraceae bacterium]|nr:MAG: hypothetical protein DHS20C18_18180 [Saprospiraceae bacterium]